MAWGRLVRWSFARIARDPAYWLMLTLSALLWPALVALSPLGLTTRDATLTSPLYEIALLVLLAGSAYGVFGARRMEPLVAPLSPLRRLLAEATFLGCATWPALAAATALPLVWSQTPAPGAFFWQLALGLLHVHAVGLVVLRAPWRAATSIWVFLFLTWIAPALAGIESGLGRTLGPHTLLMDLSETVSAGTAWRSALQPIIGWLVVGLLLATPLRAVHALRHPG